jgi:C-terminal processing protease CtpA/Prc
VKGKDAITEALSFVRSPSTPPDSTPVLPALPEPRVDVYKAGLPSLEERLLAAFQIWGTFHYLSAYPHLMDKDLATVLRQFIPRFISVTDERSYVLTVAEMVAQIQDTHAIVSSSVLAQYFGVAPAPAQIQFVEGKPVVRRALEPGAALQVGDVILKIDGRDVADRIRDLTPYVAASTPQSLRHRLAARLLSGRHESKAKLLVDRRGTEVVVEVERSTAYTKQLGHSRSGEVYRMLPGNIGYVDLERLPPQDVDAMFDKFRETRAIVMDMRGYPQGTAWSIAPRLTEKTKVPAASFRRPNWTSPDVPMSDVKARLDYRFEQYLPDTDKWRYKGETVVLIDERAISQSEHSCLFYRAANGTKFIGSPTTGANGDVRSFTVPGAIRINYSGHEVKHIDGRQLQRVGIQPDILIQPTVAGIRENRDEVLETALEYLRSRK